MSFRPTFRNPDKFQELPFRKWIREHMPSGSDGFIAEDLDLVVRVYGAKYGTDPIGKFRLIELKFGNNQPGIAQQKLFGLIDKMLRVADPKAERYLGYFIVNYTNEDWDRSTFKVNGISVTLQQIMDLLLCKPFSPRAR